MSYWVQIENQDYSNFTLTLVKRLALNLTQDLYTLLWMFWQKAFRIWNNFFSQITIKVTIFIFWSEIFVIKQFLWTFQLLIILYKNNQDTFFEEHQILYKRCVMIIFSKICSFYPITYFFKMEKLEFFKKTRLKSYIFQNG